MLKLGLKMASIALAFFYALSAAHADCVQEPRMVKLSAEQTISLTSFRCRTSDGTGEVRVEFQRLSDFAASVLIAKGTTTLLPKAVGKPRLVENEVGRTYTDLLRRFGVNEEMPQGGGETNTYLTLSTFGEPVDRSTERVDDKISLKKLRTLLGTAGRDPAGFPAASDISSLRSKTIPNGWSYFYSFDAIECQNATTIAKDDFVCRQFDNDKLEMKFWRSMRADDVKNYTRNVQAYNALLRRVLKDKAKTDAGFNIQVDEYLKLMSQVAGDTWPDDLVLLVGNYSDTACGVDGNDLPGIDGWEVNYHKRDVVLDVVMIENISQQPVTIGDLFGNLAPVKLLRPLNPQADAQTAISVANMAATLAPGAQLLVPTKIVFLAPADLGKDFKRYEQSMADIQRQLGASGFSGNIGAYQPPRFKDYVYGPELTIAGFRLNGQRIDIARQPAANFIDLTVAQEAGSCPYLLSWDARDREWVNHGKVLDKAPSREREYTETRVSPGFVSRFRIEEREPELAFIDHVELVVALSNGNTVTLKPDNATLAARDGDYLKLYWGDAIDIAFALPKGIAETNVTESRFVVTGYYLRYSTLQAQRDQQEQRGGLLRRAAVAPGSTLTVAASTDAVCRAPVGSRARLLGRL